MALSELYAAFGPAPATPAAAAETALAGYFVLAALAAIAERLRNVSKREQRPSGADPMRLANRPISG
jgi:hypothetical protein